MRDCILLFEKLLSIGDFQTQSWFKNQMIHIQNSNDIACEDFVIGLLSQN